MRGSLWKQHSCRGWDHGLLCHRTTASSSSVLAGPLGNLSAGHTHRFNFCAEDNFFIFVLRSWLVQLTKVVRPLCTRAYHFPIQTWTLLIQNPSSNRFKTHPVTKYGLWRLILLYDTYMHYAYNTTRAELSPVYMHTSNPYIKPAWQPASCILLPIAIFISNSFFMILSYPK